MACYKLYYYTRTQSTISLFSPDALMWTRWQTGMLLWFGKKPSIQLLSMPSIKKWTQELLWWCLLSASRYTGFITGHNGGEVWPTDQLHQAEVWNLKRENVKANPSDPLCCLVLSYTFCLCCCLSSLLLFRYTKFLKGFLESGEKYFLVGFRVTYYIFTDNENEVPEVSCC